LDDRDEVELMIRVESSEGSEGAGTLESVDERGRDRGQERAGLVGNPRGSVPYELMAQPQPQRASEIAGSVWIGVEPWIRQKCAGELWWLLRRWHAEVDDGPVQISPRKHEAALLSVVAVPVEPRNKPFIL
jgi:hypothetical protein